jgi:hypothetical protein
MIDATAARRWADAVMGLTGIAVLGYVGARAALVPLTYDEAIAHARYVTGPAASLLDFATATNHLLASALARASVAVAGDTPLGLRLPSLPPSGSWPAACVDRSWASPGSLL